MCKVNTKGGGAYATITGQTAFVYIITEEGVLLVSQTSLCTRMMQSSREVLHTDDQVIEMSYEDIKHNTYHILHTLPCLPQLYLVIRLQQESMLPIFQHPRVDLFV